MNKKNKKELLQKQITLNNFFVVFALFFILVLSSCRKFSINNNYNNSNLSSNKYKAYKKFNNEARILDIPFPIDTELWDLSNSNSSDLQKLALKFKWDKLSQNQNVIDFYLTEMEYCGWNLVNYVKFKESCLVFQKPSKTCVILAKKLSDKIEEVSIFVMPKKYFD